MKQGKIMSFNVGQVIYLLSSKDTKVYPALVVEETKRKTLDEEVTTYSVRLPDREKTEIELESISAEIFLDMKSLEKKMISTAKQKISDILETAKKIEKDNLLQGEDHNAKNEQSAEDAPAIVNNSEKLEVDLGDGTTAKISVEDLEKIRGVS